ncbi:class I SAM-dependent methyltransferase [Trinickia sp. NRRL B-1857]|uniref:class I SAM-dependent methyltransferase n=1 Tax=Trinickia sp. NRRL B-1857 TaxID=3162879 RepID=UPI003D275C5E
MTHQQDSDIWSEWVLRRRHGDDTGYRQAVHADVTRYADRVLDGARLRDGMTLADIGTGDGLVGMRAIERFGPSLRVLMTDISAPLLRHAAHRATERGVEGQCTFVEGPADKLSGIGDAAVDAVAMRAVLAYVEDKSTAMREFYRILKPGGRLSMAEPVLRDEAFEVCALKRMVDARPPGAGDAFFPLLLRWRSAQFPDTEEKASALPITNYGERDLVRFAIDAGFIDIHLELHIDVVPADPIAWDVFVESSPHPLAPSLKAVLDEQFTKDERAFFEARLRPLVESGKQFGAQRIAWLTATKSGH